MLEKRAITQMLLRPARMLLTVTFKDSHLNCNNRWLHEYANYNFGN